MAEQDNKCPLCGGDSDSSDTLAQTQECLECGLPTALWVQVAAIRADRARLAAVVERLPKTADGVPITPGMIVWTHSLYAPVPVHASVQRIVIDDDGMYVVLNLQGVSTREPNACYSTEQAAREAAGGKT